MKIIKNYMAGGNTACCLQEWLTMTEVKKTKEQIRLLIRAGQEPEIRFGLWVRLADQSATLLPVNWSFRWLNMLFEERKLFRKRKYISTSSLWEIDGSYLSEILFNAVFSVGFKSLLRLNVDSHPPHVHGKLSNQIFAVRVKRADSRNLGPLIPLSKLCQSLSLIDVWGACAEEVWISLFIWELSGSRGIWNLRNVLVFCGLSDGNWATRSGLSDNKVSVVWEILKESEKQSISGFVPFFCTKNSRTFQGLSRTHFPFFKDSFQCALSNQVFAVRVKRAGSRNPSLESVSF